ncbi:class I SAM-dependent methyltransferase [Sphingomonas sp. RHCKR7]|uniref:class I SAM-dependent methyltransferase n=1 Tax=Sphingomonas folli TaxID=2862497 RepID=UPI001C662E54|nr:class I SAM-dependent methyltransferase [Sphingomonas folli]MBW6526746.1 class I SAM-dependent methyltransferase [Sphingomonas folli]
MQEGYYDHSRPEALDLLPSCPRRILDIGCGRGGVTRSLKQRCPGAQSVGLDLFLDPSFDYAAIFDSFSQVDLERDELPVDVASFDLVLLLDVMEHLRQPEGLLDKLVPAAAPGCLFLVSLPNFHYYSNLLTIVRTGRFRYTEAGILDRTHVRFFGLDDARELLTKQLTIIAERPFNPFENVKSRIIGRLLGDKYRAYQNIFLCRKP